MVAGGAGASANGVNYGTTAGWAVVYRIVGVGGDVLLSSIFARGCLGFIGFCGKGSGRKDACSAWIALMMQVYPIT